MRFVVYVQAVIYKPKDCATYDEFVDKYSDDLFVDNVEEYDRCVLDALCTRMTCLLTIGDVWQSCVFMYDEIVGEYGADILFSAGTLFDNAVQCNRNVPL